MNNRRRVFFAQLYEHIDVGGVETKRFTRPCRRVPRLTNAEMPKRLPPTS